MSQQSFDLTPGQNLVNQNLGFTPLSAVIDNMTPYWIRLPDAGRYIAPYSTGGSVPLINAMGGTVLWEAPAIAGIAQIPFISDAGVLHITFVDEVLSYTPPSPIPDIAFNNSESFTFNVGTTLSQTISFLAIGTRIDNPSGTAYTISGTGLIIPPWTIGWTVDILPPYNSIVIAPVTNPSGVPNVSIGGPLTLVAYSGRIGISSGIVGGSTQGVWQGVNTLDCGAVGSPVFTLEPTNGNLTLSKITFRNPHIAQTYSIYRAAGVASGGAIRTIPPLNAAYGNVPATVRDQDSGFRSIGTAVSATGTSIGVPIPTTAVVGDTLTIVLALNASRTISDPAGWTRRLLATTFGVWTKICTLADIGSTVTVSWNTSTTGNAICFSVTGIWDSIGSNTPWSANTVVSFGTTTAVATKGLIVGVAIATSLVTFTPGATPADLLERFDSGTTPAGGAIEIVNYNFTAAGLQAISNSTASGTSSGIAITISYSLTPLTVSLGTKIATTNSVPAGGATTTVDITAILGSPITAQTGATGGLVVVGDTGPVRVFCDPLITT